MGILSPNIISTKHISYLKIQAMQTSIFVVLGLLLMVCYSNSFPQFAENAKSQEPCGLICVCMKPGNREIARNCKNLPTTVPDRCKSSFLCKSLPPCSTNPEEDCPSDIPPPPPPPP